MDYPDKFIRGISSVSHINADGRPTSEIFLFNENAQRTDGFSEASINWCDDDDALSFTMEQRNNNAYRFQYGVAIVERMYADGIVRNPIYKDIFKYERSGLPDNKYHGNLLLKHEDKAIKKQIRTQIALTFASYAQIIPREQN